MQGRSVRCPVLPEQRSRPAPPRRRESGEEKVILTALCGHGFLDLPAYNVFLQGNLKDIPLSREKLEEAFAHLPMREAAAK